MFAALRPETVGWTALPVLGGFGQEKDWSAPQGIRDGVLRGEMQPWHAAGSPPGLCSAGLGQYLTTHVQDKRRLSLVEDKIVALFARQRNTIIS